jgi:lysophospholipase L1-like esterase
MAVLTAGTARAAAGTVAGLAVAAVSVLVSPGTANAESNGGVRVMPLGDSITDGFNVPGGYRTGLWQRFTANGNVVDFVGSLFYGPGNLGDHDHEGHSGWRIDQLDASIVPWLQVTAPRTVLLHIGTNDIVQNRDLPNAPARLSGLIDKITATVPSADVFVATIIPIAGQDATVGTFNAAIPGIVQSRVNAGRHVHLVDMHAALTTADLADGVHPNAGGYEKMAATWYAALRSVPGSIDGPSTPPPPRLCTATYQIANQWQGGFQANLTVTAGNAPLTGWTVRWTFPAGQTINQMWSGTFTASGSAITTRNVDYNGNVPANGTTTFGFIGTWNGTNPAPTTVTCTTP